MPLEIRRAVCPAVLVAAAAGCSSASMGDPAGVDAAALDAAAPDARDPDAPADAAPDAPADAPPDSRTIDVPDPSGDALLGLDLAFLPGVEDPPVQFRVTWTLHPDGTLDGRYQPLCVNPSICPDGRVPVGAPIVVTGAEVSEGGRFTHRASGTLPAEANPISGTAQPFEGSFAGTIVSADRVCGDLTGTVAGIDLAGATFGAVRITDGLPAPAVACPR